MSGFKYIDNDLDETEYQGVKIDNNNELTLF